RESSALARREAPGDQAELIRPLHRNFGVAQRPAHSIADQAAEIFRQRARHVWWHIEAHVLFLPKPTEREGQEGAETPSFGAIGARAVKRLAHPEEDRAGFHFRRRNFILARLARYRP